MYYIAILREVFCTFVEFLKSDRWELFQYSSRCSKGCICLPDGSGVVFWIDPDVQPGSENAGLKPGWILFFQECLDRVGNIE